MFFDEKFESGISARNVSHFLPPEERKALEEELNRHGIGLVFFEQRSAQASIFKTIVVYLNEHLTELFITGLLAPAAYDAIKTTLLCLTKHIAIFFRKHGKKEETYPNMRITIGKAEVIAPIPSNLNEKQFSAYLTILQSTLKELSNNVVPKIKKYECFIVEYNDATTKLSMKTVTKYGMERVAKQRNAKDD
ncbi:MAG TPA: hypothetical protein DG577_09650 [Firmicutes bacterium]|jgi:hypothetical protein|uniref:hypothetical protein n=1 Tax=Alkalibaculum bacchi TaxID=645887 RepID=UPI000EBBEC03|nr:hypothetical protein [Alkalibaculum bacchi]HCX79664.1 hypothetical protein [Bacillota bacterium]